jgi:hypothetical protein
LSLDALEEDGADFTPKGDIFVAEMFEMKWF